ncbi:MAG: bifunctional glutamine-synthetase adenylyltransferase/deadenyltransferase [Acidobacteria bacterium]|nr:MAG: bifunctional glutamine-synthetase adenylyltransferase/deadenyltransferase [Acidobacteriota bacterium]
MTDAPKSSLKGLNHEAVTRLAGALGSDRDETAPWWHSLLEEIRSSADPVAVLNRLESIAQAAADAGGVKSSSTADTDSPGGGGERLRLSTIFETNPICIKALVAVTAASGSIALHLKTSPDDVALLATPGALPPSDPEQALERALASIHGDPVTALRMHKRREYIRIAAADLLGIPDVAEVGASLAALADACLQCASKFATDELDLNDAPTAIIAMGKLGGQELNYASDIDVIFVSNGNEDLARRHAERVIAIIGGSTPAETIFRIDVDLRPEGRAGALTRSIESFKAYWEKWAQTWEFQALLKARPAAGDLDLGGRFVEAAQPFIWPERLDPEAIRSIRAMKARTERELVKKGTSEREVKRGPGGIRDVEFAVQLLQLVHGRADPTLRDRSTLGALEALAVGGYVDTSDASALRNAYKFLRTVEHRLQIRDERQVYALPTNPTELEVLAKTLGIRGRADISAIDIFEKAYRDNGAVVRSIHERLFFRPLLEAFGAASADDGANISEEAADERLAAFGFSDIRRARAGLAELTRGLSRASRLMQQLLPLMLEWLSESPNPDLGLTELRNLVDAVGDQANLVTTFRENPTAAQHLCTVLGTSRVLAGILTREPEALGAYEDEAKGPQAIVKEARSFTSWRSDPAEQFEAIKRFHRREFLRIGTRDIIFGAPVSEIGSELAALGDSVLEVALESAIEEIPGPEMRFAIVAMGSYGGQEMNYSSDLDVIFVFDGGSPERALAVAARLFENFQGVASQGVAFKLDAALRPEGKSGPIARSLDSTQLYYQKWAETWEFQALTKARHGAGDPSLTAALLESIEPLVWPDPFPTERIREIRMMKARMERERIPAGEDAEFHLKLGPGGLTDVEFAVQLTALRNSGRDPELRRGNTLDALAALEAAEVFDRGTATRLREGYEFCTRVRNRLFLIKGRQLDSLPKDPRESAQLAESLGWQESPRSALRTEYKKYTRRARAAFEEVFYSD